MFKDLHTFRIIFFDTNKDSVWFLFVFFGAFFQLRFPAVNALNLSNTFTYSFLQLCAQFKRDWVGVLESMWEFRLNRTIKNGLCISILLQTEDQYFDRKPVVWHEGCSSPLYDHFLLRNKAKASGKQKEKKAESNFKRKTIFSVLVLISKSKTIKVVQICSMR